MGVEVGDIIWGGLALKGHKTNISRQWNRQKTILLEWNVIVQKLLRCFLGVEKMRSDEPSMNLTIRKTESNAWSPGVDFGLVTRYMWSWGRQKKQGPLELPQERLCLQTNLGEEIIFNFQN